MRLRDRLDRARADCYQAKTEMKLLTHEQRDLRREVSRQTAELRVACMKHRILMAEIRKNSLLGYELYSSSGLGRYSLEAAICVLPIQ